jgi:hypothetical protein
MNARTKVRREGGLIGVRFSGRLSARATTLPSEGSGARACRQSDTCASLLRRSATLNFSCYESGGARPLAERTRAVGVEVCSRAAKATDFASSATTSGVACRISPLLKFRWRRQTRHCSSPFASGALRLSSGRLKAAPSARELSRPVKLWKCVALTTKACARRTSSTNPRAPRARSLGELLRTDSNFSRRSR